MADPDVPPRTAGPPPRVWVSRCLLGERCRWDGEARPCEAVERLRAWLDFRPICPEMEMLGLGCPRAPIRVVRPRRAQRPRLVQPATRRDLTFLAYRAFNDWLASPAGGDGADSRPPAPDGLLLKAKSPSCGCRNVKRYPAPGATAPIGETRGFFARWAVGRWPGIPMIDERGLSEAVERARWWRRLHRRTAQRTAPAEARRRQRPGTAPPWPGLS